MMLEIVRSRKRVGNLKSYSVTGLATLFETVAKNGILALQKA